MRRAEEGYVRTNLQDTRNEAVSIQVAKDLAAGRMPSNQQIEEVLQKPIQTLEAREQTYQGKTGELATDLKGLLQSTQTFLNEKNQGQVIQDFVYHINMAITELGPSMEQTRLRKRETKRTGKIPDRTLVTADVASAMRSILYKMAVDSSFRNTLLSLFNLLTDMFVSNRTSQQGANVGQTFETGQINTPAIAQTTYPSATQHQTPEGYSRGTGTRVEHQTQLHSPEIGMEQQAHIGQMTHPHTGVGQTPSSHMTYPSSLGSEFAQQTQASMASHPHTTGIGSGMETHREPAAGTIPTYSEGYQTAGTFSQGNIPITSSSISSREAQPTSIYTTEAGSSVTVTRTGTGVYTYTSAPGMNAQAQGMQTPIEGVQAGTQYGRTEAFSTGTTPGEVTSRMENLNLGEASSISPNDEEEWNLSENEDEARQLPTLTDEQVRSFAQRFSAILPIIGESKETRNIFKGLLALLGSAGKVVGSSLQGDQEWTRNMNLQRAKLEFRIILEGLSGKSLQPLINAAIGLNDLVYQHPPILQWKQDVVNFLKFIWKKNESELQRPENQQQMTALIKRGRELIFNDHVVKNRFYAFFNEVREFLRAVERDPVNRAIANRFNVVIQHMTVVDSSGKTTLSMEGIENLQVIFLDILQSELQSIAIPRVEGSDSTTEWWVDNLFFKSLGSIPGYLRVRGSTDHTIDLNKGRSGETMGESGATHLYLKAGKIFFTIEGFQFYFARKTVPRMEDTGIADLYLNKGRGGRIRLNLDIFSKKSSEVKNLEPSVRLHIASTRCTLRGLKIRFIDAQRHKLLLKLFSPIIQRTIRTKLEAGISDAVHRAFARLENTINSSGPSIFDRVKDALAQRIGA